MKRRSFATLALGALTAAAAAPVRAADPFRLIITETETPLVPNSVQELAKTLGYYKRAGVEVELVRVQQTPSAVAALRSGQGDMANIAVAAALELVGRDQMHLRAVVSPDKALPFVIAARKAIVRPKDLEGKTFGVARVGSVDYDLSRLALAKLGVNVEKIQYLAVGQPATRAQALAAGQLDATAVSIGAWMEIPDKSALTVLLDQRAFFRAAPFISKANVVVAETLPAHASQVAAFVRGVIAASRDFAREPQHWIEAMAVARPDVKRADLEVLATAYRESWCVNGGLNVGRMKFTVDTIFGSPDLAGVRKVEPAEFLDLRFIDAALKIAGVDRRLDERG